jgi:ABC-type Fe3+/spermidine/putrescine transport system ATPase subunit
MGMTGGATVTTAVTLKAVVKHFGKRVAVQELSLDVAKGGTVGILGPSGCGKTTVLRLIAGLEQLDSGEIWFGERLASSKGRLHLSPSRRNIGFVFQDLALWPHMTVGGNLMFVLKSRGWPSDSRKSRVGEMLAKVGLKDRANEYPSHLSGGEQQRVALARALVDNPELLLLDEPLSSLDRDRRAELRHELAAIPRNLGVTMIYVTHDPADAEAFGGKTITLEPAAASFDERH